MSEKGKKPTIGAAAICKNEEKNMQGFLDNLVPWVDEVVIVDDGSTDRSEAIAARAGPKVRFIKDPRKPGEGFCDQRNKSIRASSCDWLLHLDMDMRTTPEFAREAVEKIRRGGFDAFNFRLKQFFMNRPVRGGGFQYWNQTRLARREVVRFKNKVHEQAVLDAPRQRIGQIEEPVWHLNDFNYAARLKKNIVYSELEAERIAAAGNKVGWRHFILVPLLRSFNIYFLRGGFRDGMAGLVWALYNFAGTLTWYAMAWEKQDPGRREQTERRLAAKWERPGGGDVG